jgi:hypothetical protein
MEPSGPDVDYSALRQQYADQKQEEQQQEEGDFIQVTLHLPEGDVRQLKVRLRVCCSPQRTLWPAAWWRRPLRRCCS